MFPIEVSQQKSYAFTPLYFNEGKIVYISVIEQVHDVKQVILDKKGNAKVSSNGSTKAWGRCLSKVDFDLKIEGYGQDATWLIEKWPEQGSGGLSAVSQQRYDHYMAGEDPEWYFMGKGDGRDDVLNTLELGHFHRIVSYGSGGILFDADGTPIVRPIKVDYELAGLDDADYDLVNLAAHLRGRPDVRDVEKGHEYPTFTHLKFVWLPDAETIKLWLSVDGTFERREWLAKWLDAEKFRS